MQTLVTLALAVALAGCASPKPDLCREAPAASDLSEVNVCHHLELELGCRVEPPDGGVPEVACAMAYACEQASRPADEFRHRMGC